MKEGFDCSVSAPLGFFPKFNFPEWLPNKGWGGGAATTGSSPFLESLGEPEFLPAPRDRAATAARAFTRGDRAGVGDRALPQLNSAARSPGYSSGREPQTPAVSIGRERIQGSSAETALPGSYANWPCDGKSCLAQPCSSVHIWAATSRILKTSP